MKFKNEKAYKISRTASIIVLLLAYCAGIYFLGKHTSSNSVGDDVAVLVFAIILTPWTVLVAMRRRWAVYPLIAMYFLAFFSIVTPIAAMFLIYAIRLKK
jgi:hypothetical protein